MKRGQMLRCTQHDRVLRSGYTPRRSSVSQVSCLAAPGMTVRQNSAVTEHQMRAQALKLLQLLNHVLPEAGDVTPREARRRQEAGAVLVDVREPEEWVEGHAPGGRHIPLGQLGRCLRELPHDGEVLFICHRGYRSSLAAATARRAGLAMAASVRGGLLAWERAGLPVEDARGRRCT